MLVMVTGGSRSGKSEFAEKYVLQAADKCAYIATAEILDEEMAERVRLHRERRDSRWVNYEAPYAADKTFAELGTDIGAVLFDCLTIYMCNLFYGQGSPSQELPFLERCDYVFQQIDKLLAAAKATDKLVVFVTNEVGCGIVPENKMAREYRDLAGWVNERVAKVCNKVFYCVAGNAVDMKAMAYKFPEE